MYFYCRVLLMLPSFFTQCLSFLPFSCFAFDAKESAFVLSLFCMCRYGGFPGYPVAPEPSRAPEGPGFGNPVMAEYMAQQRRREAGGPPRSQHAWYM